MKTSRIKEIEEYIKANEIVTLNTLCENFGISMNTVRRDINELVSRGCAKKVYGGVCAVSRDLIPYDERESKNTDEKKIIARAAAEFVSDGDIIFIDSGTTTHHMVAFLSEIKVTILTDSLNVSLDALAYPNLTVISTGGVLARKTCSFNGLQNIDFLHDINIKKAFMAATGVTMASGATNSSVLEYQIKKDVVEKSDTVYLLADHTKFDKSSLMTFSKLSDIDYLITDSQLPQTYLDYLSENDTKVVIAGES